ncbi:MAG: HlyD family secretion protein [Planctomycetaceae bacterium]|nr:HlyD family secretion protein [Planctomycetaceae bacterium]
MIAFLIDIYALLVWLVFFKFRWFKFDLKAKIGSAAIGALMCIGILIAVNFLHPQSMDARVFEYVVPMATHVPQAGPVTEVPVLPNVPVKKGDVLFRIDPQPYEFQVAQLEAALAAAEQNVPQLQAAYDAAAASVERLEKQQEFAESEFERFKKLHSEKVATQEQLEQATRNLEIAQASLREAQAQATKAKLAADAKTADGVNVDVAQLKAQLANARYNLDQTTVRAPVDGTVINLELQPGLVVRPGEPVLTLVENPHGIVVLTLPQEYLSLIEPGNHVEVALDMYPGKMLRGKVDAIVWATGQGQLTAAGTVPTATEKQPAGRFGVKVLIDEADQKLYRLPAGAHGAAAIYTDHGKAFRIVRKVIVRWYTWLNYISLGM